MAARLAAVAATAFDDDTIAHAGFVFHAAICPQFDLRRRNRNMGRCA